MCRDHYGEDKLAEMRKNGRQNAVKKWKLANSEYYHKNKYGAKSIPKTNPDRVILRTKPKSKREMNEARYSYVPVPVRKETEDGKAFREFFKLIFDKRTKKCLEKLKDLAKEKVFNVTIDLTLNDINSKLDDVPGKYHSLVNYANAPRDFMFDQWHGWDDNHQSAYDKFEKQIEIVFEDELKKNLDKCISRWIESVEYKMKKYCYKENENWAFCNFFGNFSEVLPNLRKQAAEAEESSEFNQADEIYFSNALDFARLRSMYFDRRNQKIDMIFEELLLTSEMGKSLEKRIDDELSQFVEYVKKKKVDAIGCVKLE